MNKIFLIVIAFVLLVPILLVEVESQTWKTFNFCHMELARDAGKCDDMWYYDFKITSTDRYVISQVYYVPLEYPNAYYDRDRQIELAGSYETVAWVENIWKWYSNGSIDEITMSNAFDYIIENNI